MATVYDGWDLKLGRPVAVKVLHPSLASEPEFRERMAFEARSAARCTTRTSWWYTTAVTIRATAVPRI